KPHLADREPGDGLPRRREDADLLDLGLEPRADRADLAARLELPVDDTHERGDAAVRVVPGVEEKGLQRRPRVALRGWNDRDDALQQLLDAGPELGASQHRGVRRDAAAPLV